MACRQARDAQAQLAESAAALDSAQVEVTQLKALAAERQRRFVMLNGTFKKKEDGLRERVEAAERQVADAHRGCEAAQAHAASAIKVKERIYIYAIECCLIEMQKDSLPACVWPYQILRQKAKLKNAAIFNAYNRYISQLW